MCFSLISFSYFAVGTSGCASRPPRFPSRSLVKGTSLGLAVLRERTLVPPHPQPLSHALWERGVPHAELFGVLKRSFSIRRKLRFRTP